MAQFKCSSNRAKMWYFLIFTTFQLITGEEAIGARRLYLTVSSLYRDAVQGSLLIDREIQINWKSKAFDSIAIYPKNPEFFVTSKLFQISTLASTEGAVETNVTLGNPAFPNGWDFESKETPINGDKCLPFFIAGLKHNTVVDLDCIKIRPTWMQDNRITFSVDQRIQIGNLTMTSLMLPGTHNSGCYKRGGSLSKRDTTGRYILTQDQSIWNQLVYGIRYLDFRIGYYPVKNATTEKSDNCFWINHDLIKVRPLAPLIAELKEFLMRSKFEIVVLDLHRFPIGFSNRKHRHDHFIEYLERELKPLAIPSTNPAVTLDEIWETNQRLIISYGEKEIQKNYDWLWPPIRQLWGNKQTVGELFDFLNSAIKNDSVREPSRGMWAAMAQLTPGPLDLLFNPKGSLREMAHQVNPNLTKWCRGSWWDKVNIVTSDFFLETDLIDIAVTTNRRKGRGGHNMYEYTT